jgi:predicted anti-sigma-YlaC factor YlaD
MGCEEFKRVSAGYLDDAAPPELQAQVEEHLERCPICSAVVRKMSLLREDIRLALCKDCCPGNLRQRISRNLRAYEFKTFFRKLTLRL